MNKKMVTMISRIIIGLLVLSMVAGLILPLLS